MKTNIFEQIPADLPEELFDVLLENKAFKLERIVSQREASPEGFWYDQAQHEWVLVLQGEAGLRFEEDEDVLHLKTGDYVVIEAHRRHRVEWTSEQTVWLALHWNEAD